MNKNISRTGVFILLLFLGLGVSHAWAAGVVKMRVVLVNPSAKKAQTKSVKTYLPKEVTMKDIKDNGGLDVEYDQEQGAFFASKNDIELAPLETKTFELVIDDVWNVSDDKLQGLRGRTDRTLGLLKGKPHYAEAEVLGKTIYGRLENILKAQNDPAASKQQHIAYYRDNLTLLKTVEDDIDKLEKILVAVGGPPNLDLIEKSDVNLKSPSSKTTWILIFIILIFVAILGGAFYFTWQRQASITENIFTKEKGNSFSELKGKGESANPFDKKAEK